MYNLLKAGRIMSHGTSITILGAPTLALQPTEPGADNVIKNAQLHELAKCPSQDRITW